MKIYEFRAIIDLYLHICPNCKSTPYGKAIKMKNNKKLKIAIIIVFILLLVFLWLLLGNFGDKNKSIKIDAGQEYTLFDEGSDEITSWSSEDENIAIIDENGNIVGLKSGTTIITVVKGDESYEYEVVVNGSSDNNENNSNADKNDETAIPNNNQPVIYAEKVSAKAGDDEIVVNVNIERNPGVLGMILAINYDDKNLTLKKAECGDALKGTLNFTKSNTFESGSRFLWDGVEINEDQIKDGTVLVLTFEADESTSKGNYPIRIKYDEGDIVNNKLIEVEAQVVNGMITIN